MLIDLKQSGRNLRQRYPNSRSVSHALTTNVQVHDLYVADRHVLKLSDQRSHTLTPLFPQKVTTVPVFQRQAATTAMSLNCSITHNNKTSPPPLTICLTVGTRPQTNCANRHVVKLSYFNVSFPSFAADASQACCRYRLVCCWYHMDFLFMPYELAVDAIWICCRYSLG